MPSLRARLIGSMLRNRHLFKKKQPIDWDTLEAVQDFRREVEAGAARFGKLPAGITASPEPIGDLYAEWISPANPRPNRILLYFHGGGYVSGTCAAHRGIVAKFVHGSNVRALVFEYRLAPENPYPAALDDALTAYQHLLAQDIPAHNIVFAGDSGGGGLCLSTLLAIRDRGLPLPFRAVVLSPYTDLLCTGKSHEMNLKRCLSPEGTPQAFGRHYAGSNDPRLPYISPYYGGLHGLPPMLIFAGSDEVLLDDSRMFAEKARQAGVDVTLRIGEGLFHCYPAMAPMFPEATQAMDEIIKFISATCESP
ncbi:MAG TPA: alpha/beta hydrolase [Bacillota bacterium]|nr:alpha/beta hydrolase [Bacillota bacterium]